MSSNVEQIKERLGIVEVVGSYVKLEKAGSNYKARCPFHNEKTPSFFVSPSRGSYYCFGCNAKGDIFSFVEQFEGLDFVGALKVLAARAGVALARENPKAKNEKDRLYRALDAATEFFEKSLAADDEVKEYLAKRGVKEATIKEWRLGFAPDSWRALHDELIKRGFNTGEMQGVGLVKKTEQSAPMAVGESAVFYDIFRGRIMFPIFDSSGRVIGFSGRLLPRLDDGKAGKYINSPETSLFNKSRVLYGLHKAKFDVRKRDYSIMVEGQMDLIMSHQAGFSNTVAVSGTALSENTVAGDTVTNLGLLTRLSNNLILAFDSDEAGFKASSRNAKTALSLGMDVKVAKMPAGEDPADIILKNPAAWTAIIKNSKHIIDFTLETLLEKKLDPRKLGKEIVALVLPYVRALQSAVDQAHFIVKISNAAGIKEEALWTELKKVAAVGEPPPTFDFSEKSKVGGGSNAAVNRQSVIEKKLLGIIYWQEGKAKSAVDLERLRENLGAILGKAIFAELLAASEAIKNDLIFQAELSYEGASNLSHETRELLINLEIETIDEKLEAVMRRVYGEKERGSKEDIELIQELSAKKQELKTQRFTRTTFGT
ncbi:MAG: DNA primase [Candidatus Taylorbacteria bacterium]|nr:DNA primase [Candidatus Taylorbacteria bacterium]